MASNNSDLFMDFQKCIQHCDSKTQTDKKVCSMICNDEYRLIECSNSYYNRNCKTLPANSKEKNTCTHFSFATCVPMHFQLLILYS
jgi:hypothetical protein